MLPRIEKILKVENFKVYCLWTTGEKRLINFKKIVDKYPKRIKEKVLSEDFFLSISLNTEAKTLYIPNILETANNELDFCPDILYSGSELIN